jgi:hypothetical protein
MTIKRQCRTCASGVVEHSGEKRIARNAPSLCFFYAIPDAKPLRTFAGIARTKDV